LNTVEKIYDVIKQIVGLLYNTNKKPVVKLKQSAIYLHGYFQVRLA